MDYANFINQFKGLNILIVGDVMIDSYIWGKVDRISPEAPVPVVAVTKREDRLGGAANVALNIQALEANPILCSVVGNDTKAEVLLNLMSGSGMETIGIINSSNRITTTKFRVIGNNMQMLRVDEEISSPLSKQEEDLFIQNILHIIDSKKIEAIIFQDYDKGCITQAVIEQITKKAKQLNIPTTVDPKKRNFNCFKDVTLFKPNLKELKEGLKIEIMETSEEQLGMVALSLQEKQNIDIVLVTLSEKGAFARDRNAKNNKHSILIPAHVRIIADVSGAGDTVISVATLCLAIGMNTEDMVKISNLAGGIVCESVGVVPISKERLMEETLKL